MKLTQKSKWFVPALAVLASAGQALAVQFAGSTVGEFNGVTGDPGMVVSPTPAASFTWGTPTVGEPNRLTIGGLSFGDPNPVDCGEWFDLAEITFFNGRTLLGTNATAVELFLDITFTMPGDATETVQYSLGLLTTFNDLADITDPTNDDFIELDTNDNPQAFEIGGSTYYLDLRFASGNNQFFVTETTEQTITIQGKVQCVPESGSTLAMLGGGLLLASGLRRKLQLKK